MKHNTLSMDLSKRWDKYKTKAKCNLSLYSPTLDEGDNEAIVDQNGEVLYYSKPMDEDILQKLLEYDATKYSNFTLVVNRNGTLWYEANKFLVDLVRYDEAYLETQRIPRDTIDDLASGLQKYKWFCDERDEEKFYVLLDQELGKIGLPSKFKIESLAHKLKNKIELTKEETEKLPLLSNWQERMEIEEKKLREEQSKEPPFWKVAKRPTSRPNHLYREHLVKRIHEGTLESTTAEKYLRPITKFYNYIIDEYGSGYLVLSNRVTMPGKITSFIKQTDHGAILLKGNEANKVPKGNNGKKEALGYIRDGSYTKPLPKAQQQQLFELLHKIDQPEMTAAHLFAINVAARVRTVFTLRLCHFMNSIPTVNSSASMDTWRKENNIYQWDEIYSIKVGPSELLDTKGLDAEYLLKVPGHLMIYMQEFCMSERTRHRRANIKHPQPNPLHEYVFITKNFNPYYCAKSDPNKAMYSTLPDGGAMRTFNSNEIKPNIDFEYKFHFLRASGLWNMLQGLINQGVSEDEALKEVQSFAGHKSKETTKGYLDWKPNEELRYKHFDDHAKKLYKWAGIEIDDEIGTVEDVERNDNILLNVAAHEPSIEDLLSEIERLKSENERFKQNK